MKMEMLWSPQMKGIYTERKIQLLREKRRQQTAAATKIQALWRGYTARNCGPSPWLQTQPPTLSRLRCPLLSDDTPHPQGQNTIDEREKPCIQFQPFGHGGNSPPPTAVSTIDGREKFLYKSNGEWVDVKDWNTGQIERFRSCGNTSDACAMRRCHLAEELRKLMGWLEEHCMEWMCPALAQQQGYGAYYPGGCSWALRLFIAAQP